MKMMMKAALMSLVLCGSVSLSASAPQVPNTPTESSATETKPGVRLRGLGTMFCGSLVYALGYYNCCGPLALLVNPPVALAAAALDLRGLYMLFANEYPSEGYKRAFGEDPKVALRRLYNAWTHKSAQVQA